MNYEIIILENTCTVNIQQTFISIKMSNLNRKNKYHCVKRKTINLIFTLKGKCYNNVLYMYIDISIVLITGPPKVHMLSQQDILEGRNLSVTCKATPGNPSLTTFYWTKVDIQGFRQNGATLHIPNIQRNSSGTYRCTAENNYSNGEKGTHNQSMVVNVLCMRSVYNYMIMMTTDFRIIVQNDGNQFKKSVKENTFLKIYFDRFFQSLPYILLNPVI